MREEDDIFTSMQAETAIRAYSFTIPTQISEIIPCLKYYSLLFLWHITACDLFNENHLRPCPMLENPEMLRQMIAESGARSTDLQSPESAEHLCAKCASYAESWKQTAEKLWNEKNENNEEN